MEGLFWTQLAEASKPEALIDPKNANVDYRLIALKIGLCLNYNIGLSSSNIASGLFVHRERSKTMWTKFWTFLTPVPLVDSFA